MEARLSFAAWCSIFALAGCHGQTEGAATDAGFDTGAPPLVSDPGAVSCGAQRCTQDPCCENLADGSGGCLQPPDTCPAAADGQTFFLVCDESGDCPAGQECCMGINQETLCTRCDLALVPTVCKSDSQCNAPGTSPDAMVPCIPQPCAHYTLGICGQVLGPGCTFDAGL